MAIIPKSLPSCRLIENLSNKADARHDIDFNFLGHLDDFRNSICSIIGRINILFPEYTPHDDQYHIRNLFHVADLILGNQQLESMNSVELFMLACALYAHDWGMAVSDSEKQFIVTGQPPEKMSVDEQHSLQFDRESFCRFASKRNLALSTLSHADDVPLEIWQEYVRQTHAIRSGARARLYFEHINTGVAEGVMRICESHSLNFEDLSDVLYPINFSVLREEVNLRALAIYLRLIDLFDLGQDRTPYVLWKFVAPRNPRSAMEWIKHRALQPITCPAYLQGRSIRVDGSTDDHEVFAALEDLRQYCELQLKGCNDILARMNDPRHKLDIYSIEWRVATRGFKPISIQFEFDRESMFNLLSEEIYQGDFHVFLRELLQNSIDAIRFRRALLQRKGLTPNNLGVIQVTVQHEENGNAIVTWKDDGIGMDEYIISNYLAVAGKSYYRSADFQREGIDMNPISRFGIGILSCFMVADLIQIETFKDPYLPPSGPPLKITIPAINRQFRTEVLALEGAQVGTTVKIYVDVNKITSRGEGRRSSKLNVTSYLTAITGFVEFPIVIKEDDKKTIILNPYQNVEEAKSRFGQEYQIISLSLRYPWSETILPQDIPTANALLREEHYDLKRDLGLEDYEGSLIFLVPDSNSTDFYGQMGDEIKVTRVHKPEYIDAPIRWSRGYRYSEAIFPSMFRSSQFGVYRDGILVPQVQALRVFPRVQTHETYDEYIGRPSYYESRASLLLVNFTKSNQPQLDVSRTSFIDKSNNWVEPIFNANLQHLLDKHLKALLALEPAKRLYQMARIAVFYNISPETLIQFFPEDQWPIPLFNKSSDFDFANWAELSNRLIRLPPELIREELGLIANKVFFEEGDKYDGFLTHWAGKTCIALFATDRINTETLKAIRVFFQLLLGRTHHLSSISFLNPPWEGNPPLLQYVLEPIDIPQQSPESVDQLLEKACKDIQSLGNGERILLRHQIRSYFGACPFMTNFPAQFAKSYAYEDSVLNIENPGVEILLSILCKVALSRIQKSLSEYDLGRLQDASKYTISGIPDRFNHSKTDLKKWESSLRGLGELATSLGLIKSFNIAHLVPSISDFIPGSMDFLDIKLRYTKIKGDFGQPLA